MKTGTLKKRFYFVSHEDEIFLDPEHLKYFGCMLASIFIPEIFSISKLCIFRAFNKGPEFETEMNEDRKYSIITDIGQ